MHVATLDLASFSFGNNDEDEHKSSTAADSSMDVDTAANKTNKPGKGSSSSGSSGSGSSGISWW